MFPTNKSPVVYKAVGRPLKVINHMGDYRIMFNEDNEWIVKYKVSVDATKVHCMEFKYEVGNLFLERYSISSNAYLIGLNSEKVIVYRRILDSNHSPVTIKNNSKYLVMKKKTDQYQSMYVISYVPKETFDDIIKGLHSC